LFGTKKVAQENKEAKINAKAALFTEEGKHFKKGVVELKESMPEEPPTPAHDHSHNHSAVVATYDKKTDSKSEHPVEKTKEEKVEIVNTGISKISYMKIHHLANLLSWSKIVLTHGLIKPDIVIECLNEFIALTKACVACLAESTAFIKTPFKTVEEFISAQKEVRDKLIKHVPAGFEQTSFNTWLSWRGTYTSGIDIRNNTSVDDSVDYLFSCFFELRMDREGTGWKQLSISQVNVHFCNQAEKDAVSQLVIKAASELESLETACKALEKCVGEITSNLSSISNSGNGPLLKCSKFVASTFRHATQDCMLNISYGQKFLIDVNYYVSAGIALANAA